MAVCVVDKILAFPNPSPRAVPGSGLAETRLKRLIESAPASIIVASPDGRVLAANREALTLLGINRLEDLLGGGVAECVASGDRERFQRFVAQVCAGEAATLEYELARADGATRFVETRAVPLSPDGVVPAAFLSVTWDVSERRLVASTGLRQTEMRRELLEAQLLAQRETYEQALREARAACEQTARDLAKAQATVDQVVREWTEEQEQWRAKLSDLMQALSQPKSKATLGAADRKQAGEATWGF
jgi:PAS domain S-box-containing protein